MKKECRNCIHCKPVGEYGLYPSWKCNKIFPLGKKIISLSSSCDYFKQTHPKGYK